VCGLCGSLGVAAPRTVAVDIRLHWRAPYRRVHVGQVGLHGAAGMTRMMGKEGKVRSQARAVRSQARARRGGVFGCSYADPLQSERSRSEGVTRSRAQAKGAGIGAEVGVRWEWDDPTQYASSDKLYLRAPHMMALAVALSFAHAGDGSSITPA
jgi:hypothetical protein